MLLSNSKRDVFAWKRGETTSSAAQIMDFNAITAENFVKRTKVNIIIGELQNFLSFKNNR